MGNKFYDQYSLLHFSVGVVAYFIGIPLIIWNVIHILFEIVENTDFGIRFINKYLLWFWAGGKDKPDKVINNIGDIVFGALGWIISYELDSLYR